MSMNLDAHTLLLVEDNEDDVFIFRRAYKQAKLNCPLQVAEDGEEASDYLLGQGRYADRAKHPLPALVFLDLKLPLKSGLEVLATIREQPQLANLCVVVLTSSAEERDVTRAHELGAQAYLVKPPSAATLAEVMTLLRGHLAGVPLAEIPRLSGDKFETPPVLTRSGPKP
jgi:CheY-like chemotaxis protein